MYSVCEYLCCVHSMSGAPNKCTRVETHNELILFCFIQYLAYLGIYKVNGSVTNVSAAHVIVPRYVYLINRRPSKFPRE